MSNNVLVINTEMKRQNNSISHFNVKHDYFENCSKIISKIHRLDSNIRISESFQETYFGFQGAMA